jgi:anti-sigma factor RsiW
MDCSRFREHIQRFVDGELPDRLVAEFQAHLSFCGECAAELREISAVRGALAGWGAVELAAPAGFADRVMAAAQTLPRPAPSGRLRSLADRARLARGAMVSPRAVAYSALALAAVAIGLESRHRRRSREAKV